VERIGSGGKMTPLSIVGLVLVAGLAWTLRADPWKVSMGRGIAEFTPQYIAAPPPGKYDHIPRDKENKLRNGEIMWRGQLLGPESLAFDSQGRGPYTSVSDGRIIRYDGPRSVGPPSRTPRQTGMDTFAFPGNQSSSVFMVSPGRR